jgi:hypothetical protein
MEGAWGKRAPRQKQQAEHEEGCHEDEIKPIQTWLFLSVYFVMSVSAGPPEIVVASGADHPIAAINC